VLVHRHLTITGRQNAFARTRPATASIVRRLCDSKDIINTLIRDLTIEGWEAELAALPPAELDVDVLLKILDNISHLSVLR
jgi:hypothetical protein